MTPHLASSCKRVLISQMGLVAVIAVNPVKNKALVSEEALTHSA